QTCALPILVSPTEELERVAPVVEAIARELDVIISVDTSTPAVMRESARLGAGLINDVRSLQRDGALDAAADTGLPVCLMHMRGEPGNMQDNPQYPDIVSEVRDFLVERVRSEEHTSELQSRENLVCRLL